MRLPVYAQLFRPLTLVFPFTAGITVGLMSAIRNDAFPDLWWKLPLIALTLAVANGAANVINGVYDVELDKVNKPNRPIPAGRVSWQDANSIGVILLGFALVLGFNLSYWFGMILSAILLLAWAYSAPPRLRRFLVFSNLSIAVPRGGLIVIATYAVFGNPFDPVAIFGGLMIGAFVFGANTTKDFADETGDKMGGIRNFVTVFGKRQASFLMLPFLWSPYLFTVLGVWAGYFSIGVLWIYALIPLTAYMSYLIIADADKPSIGENTRLWILFYAFSALLVTIYAVGNMLP